LFKNEAIDVKGGRKSAETLVFLRFLKLAWSMLYMLRQKCRC